MTPELIPQQSRSKEPIPIGKYLVGAAVGAIGVSGVAAAAVAGLGGLVAYSAARARGPWGTDDPPQDLPFEEVEFSSAEDGTRICGWFFPSPLTAPQPVLIFCHGAWTGRRECLPWALRLRAEGYNVLVFDFRAHGHSDGKYITVGHHETRDVLGAVAFVKSRPEVDPGHIGVIGFSMGAAASIRATAMCPDIKALVADSAYADFEDAVTYSFHRVGRLPSYPFAPIALGWARWLVNVNPKLLRPVDYVEQIAPRPILIIHGGADEIVPIRHAQQLFEAAREPKDLWLAPDALHVGARDLYPNEWYARVSAFMRQSIGAPFEASRAKAA